MRITKMKKILALLLSGAMIFSGMGSVVIADEEEAVADEAVEEDSQENSEEESSSEEVNVVEEEEEEFMSSPDEVEAYYDFVGEEDDFKIYIQPDDYKDRIEEGINKTVKDEDEAKDQIKDIQKHLKHVELAMIDSATGKLVAELEEIEHDKEQTIWFSEAGRFLVFLNADNTKVLKIRYRVSTIDSEYLFLTKDQQTLELYATDYKSVRATMQNVFESDAKTLYKTEDEMQWAVLNADKDEVEVCVRQVAENDKMKMYFDEDTCLIGIENKENNYTWWSSPLNASRDTRATKLLVTDLQSSAVLTYGDSSTRGITNLRSRNAAEVTAKEIENGLLITYEFSKCGVTIPISYTLEEDYLSASVNCADIKETMTDKGIVATQLTIMGAFGAGTATENGYFVIPDGSGALIRFNNGKDATKSYTSKVYGRDITNVPNTKPAVTEEVYMPVYGIVKDGNAMAVIIEKGDGNATLNASVSGQSLSSFNICSFNFQLRGSDTYAMAGDYGNLTVFEDGAIKTKEIKLRYYPIADEDASYMNIAETYRNYLLTDGGVSKKAQANQTQMFLDLYGGTMKSRSVLGIPITMKTSMTSFSEAQKIISGLVDSGVSDMSVIYNNWTDEGISGKVDNKAKPSNTLGGNSDFKKLTSYLNDKNFDFYPSVNNKVFKNGNGYYSFSDTTIRISNAYSRQMTYNLSYGVQDTTKKTVSLLSPATFTEVYNKLSSQYSKKGISGVSLGEMTSTLWGDYGKQNMGRDDTKETLQSNYQTINNAGLSILADSCASYAFPYVDKISDVPLQSSGFDVFDEDIPFYQLVMHGVIPYSGTAINGSADSTQAFLTSVATGCNPAYDMIYAEASDLKDTDLDKYFYSHYLFWVDTASEEYQIAKEVLSSVSDKVITDYVRNGDISVTVYEDGTQVKVDYAKKTITVGGKDYSLADDEKGE